MDFIYVAFRASRFYVWKVSCKLSTMNQITTDAPRFLLFPFKFYFGSFALDFFF